MFTWIKSTFGKSVDVLINNAALPSATSLLDLSPKEMQEMTSTNIVALTQCTQLAIKSMEESKVRDGHVININR